MWELRWVLLGLGAFVVIGVYLWTVGAFKRRARTEPSAHVRTEPKFGTSAADEQLAPPIEPDSPPAGKPMRPIPERIITLRLIPRSEELSAERTVAALHGAGLAHGRYSIFHLHDELHGTEPLFSVASLTEPGTFDLENLGDSSVAGLSFFLVLPGVGDPVMRFDKLIETARGLAVELDAELHDESGSSWSVQRERYVREEMIEYRHYLERQ